MVQREEIRTDRADMVRLSSLLMEKERSMFMCLSLAAIGIGWIALGMLAGNLGGEKWVLAVDFLWLPAGCVFLLVKAQKYDRNK